MNVLYGYMYVESPLKSDRGPVPVRRMRESLPNLVRVSLELSAERVLVNWRRVGVANYGGRK